ncbi:DUF2381 family protein [Myxococcaceae bacterium GXIMD 01537]
MVQPLRLALALALVWGAAARAEAASGERTRRERTVLVSGASDEPPPEVHVAWDTPTLLLFPAPIQKETLTFDETRLRVLDAGERSLIVQPVEDFREGERIEIGVVFADGRMPARADFVLVTDPSKVDIRVDVQRSALPEAPCPAEALARVPRPEDFVLLGYVGEEGVSTSGIKGVKDTAQGLSGVLGVSYRGRRWGLVDLKIQNSSGRPPWTPREATLTGRAGLPLRARLVTEKEGAILPGKERRVLAVVESLELSAGSVFTLEVRGEDDRRLVIPNVRFPMPVAGGKP